MSKIRGFEFKPENLIGTSDPYSLATLQAGERVVACERCQVGYQLATMRFLYQAGLNDCLNCNQSDMLKTLDLPKPAGVVPPIVIAPTPQVPPVKTQPVVELADIEKHIGQIVDFRGYVHAVQRSQSSGTVFVKFEKTKSPVQGFRLVIFNSYLDAWRKAQIDWESYAGRHVLVHGVIRDDPNWGIQMLIDRPELIKVVEGDAPPVSAPSASCPSAQQPATPRSSGGITWRDQRGPQ
ncbi:MAG: hypothetical protein ACKOCK_06815 [Chloroflexota bacterium]